MRVKYHSDFENIELKEGQVHHAVLASSCFEIIVEKSEWVRDVFINGKKVTVVDYSQINFTETAQLIVSTDGGVKSYEVKSIVKLLAPEFSSVYGEFDYQFQNIQGMPLDAILSGDLKMYAIEQSAEVKDITEILRKIELTFPAFKRVCEKPKSHLKAINEVRPIETVKRVGHESIPYLASHSEDWLARTASGLKPSRLFSRVEDDDFWIYENRFVKTAIDEICLRLRRERNRLKDQISQIKGIMNSNVQTNSFGFDAGFAMAVAELIQDNDSSSSNRSKQLELAEKLYKKTAELWKKFRDLHNSRLYKYLRRAKRVVSPYNETNILLMDKNYSEVYKLWRDKEVQKFIAPKERDSVSSDEMAEWQSSYKLFCQMLCEYAANTMNFVQYGDGEFIREADSISIVIREENRNLTITIMDAQKRELKIERGLGCPESFGKFEYINQTLFWSNNTTDDEINDFCKRLQAKDTQGRQFAEAQARYVALKKAISDKQREYGKAKAFKIVILSPFCSIEDETQNRFSDYMRQVADRLSRGSDYIVVALPKCEMAEQRMTAYAKRFGDKILFLPLTLFDINSYRRLQGLFLRLIMKLEKSKCPYCGANMRGRECTANDCGLVVTSTRCDKPNCRHEYTYLSYNLRQETIDNMRQVESDDFFAQDSLFQYKDVVELTATDKIRPICPKCFAGAMNGE